MCKYFFFLATDLYILFIRMEIWVLGNVTRIYPFFYDGCICIGKGFLDVHFRVRESWMHSFGLVIGRYLGGFSIVK